MTSIKTLKEKKPNYFHKILGLKVKQNAMVEINNLISMNKRNVVSIPPKEISRITSRYNVNLERNFHREKLEIYHSFLEHYAKKGQIDKKSVEELKHLSNLLLIKAEDCRKELEKVYAECYHRRVKKLMKNERIDDHEQENLEFLKNGLFDQYN